MLKRKKKNKLPGVGFWLVSFCCGVLLSGFHGERAQPPAPELYSIVAALTLRVVMLHFSCC